MRAARLTRALIVCLPVLMMWTSGCGLELDERARSAVTVTLSAPSALGTGEKASLAVRLSAPVAARAVEVIDQQLGHDLLLATATAQGPTDYVASWQPGETDDGPYLLRAKVLLDSSGELRSEQVSLTVTAIQTMARKGPAGLSATNEAGKIRLTWSAVNGSTGYTVFRGTAAGVAATAANRLTAVTSPTHLDSSVVSGTTYYYVVTSYVVSQRSGKTHESAPSLEVSAQAGATTTDSEAPKVSITAPASDATYTSGQTVSLTATASDNVGVTRVEFYDGTSLKGTDTSAPYTFSWAISGADNGAHSWTARAFDAAGNNAYSAPRTLTVSIATVPAAPTGVTATAGVLSNTISWSSVSGATSYEIYFSTTSGVTKTSGTRIAGVTSPYVHSGLSAGVTYYYVVAAVNAAGSGPASTQVSATPQSAPDTVAPTFAGLTSATAQSASSVALSWSAATDLVTPSSSIVYDVYQSTTGTIDFSSVKATTAAGATSYTVTGLAASTTYTFAVRARDAAGNRDTNTVTRSATTQAAPPTGPTPPFGSTVGVTAANFTSTDCSGTSFDLHTQYNKYPSVVILLNSAAFG